MSARSIRRANERRTAKERRREALRRKRAGLATGAAIGATALFAGSAHAAPFEVNTLADGPADACAPSGTGDGCKLRDAITDANATGEADTITFASGLTGQIVLTENELAIAAGGLTIDGPGKSVLSISGDNDANGPDVGDFRIFNISSGPDETTIADLTLTEGGGANTGSTTLPGGAVYIGASSEDVTIVDSDVTASRSAGRGGAIEAHGALALVRTGVSGSNTPAVGGGVSAFDGGAVTLENSTVSGNTSSDGGGGLYVGEESSLDVLESTISGNTTTGVGGGISLEAFESKYAELDVTDSVISGNTAAQGGGVAIFGNLKYTSASITNTTISGNDATDDGGGLMVGRLFPGGEVLVDRSTISGNEAEDTGGGIRLGATGEEDAVRGEFVVVNSTVSGNDADFGGGVSVGEPGQEDPPAYGDGLDFANSTIAANTAATAGGGFFLSSYDTPDGDPGDRTSSTIPLTSMIVGDNAPQDLDRADDSDGGGFDLAFTLVENAGDAPLFQSAGDHNIIGQDPQLGGLGSNGGPTQTHLPAQSSPAIDKGDAPPRVETDQRGGPRTLDGAPANPDGGDGTDIGSVEIDRVPAAETPPQQQTTPPPQQTTTQVPVPIITRRVPGGIIVRVRPRRDFTAPFTFRTTGRIIPPTGMSAQEACGTGGLVSVQVKRTSGLTISTRRTTLRPDCSFRSSVTFQNASRFFTARRLKFTVRFTGNERLEQITARSLFRRVRRAAERR